MLSCNNSQACFGLCLPMAIGARLPFSVLMQLGESGQGASLSLISSFPGAAKAELLNNDNRIKVLQNP